MSFSPDLVAFVQTAVRLPADRLRRIDRAWERLGAERAIVSELVQDSQEVREEVTALRDYVIAEARRAAEERVEDRLIPEDIAEAIFPAARALLLRKALLETSARPETGRAFDALTAPFADFLQTYLRRGERGKEGRRE
jgi:hypothetical protein